MRKVGIITIQDLDNCGNRLQNYALQEALKKINCEVYTLRNSKLLNDFDNYFTNFLRLIKRIIIFYIKGNKEKIKKYQTFNKLIKFKKGFVTCKSKKLKNEFDYFIVGSDQVWKPTRLRMSYMDLLGFADSSQKVSYAASFGISEISKKASDKLSYYLNDFKHLSVREETGKEIIKKATGREDVMVHIDPTMLLNKEEWSKIENKNILKRSKKKIVLTYFLGEDEHIRKIYRKFASDEYEVVEFLSEKSNYGPQDFLSLVHNAELVLTDSFHASVFSIIFNTKFYVLNREEKNVNDNNMNSRLDTLLSKFKLEKRKINNVEEIDITDNCNFEKVEKILKEEQKKSFDYLKNVTK